MQEPEKDTTPDAAVEAASPPVENDAVDSTPSLEDMIRQAELKAEEHHDAWLRAKAETERKPAKSEAISVRMGTVIVGRNYNASSQAKVPVTPR